MNRKLTSLLLGLALLAPAFACGAPWCPGSGESMSKLDWAAPSEVGGAVATGEDEQSQEIANAAIHLQQKPILRYSYRPAAMDSKDDNYKLSRRVEFSVFNNSKVRDFIAQSFRAEQSPIVAGDNAATASVVFYAYNGIELHRIDVADLGTLKPSAFINVMKAVAAKHTKLLKQEIADFEARKKAEKVASKATAKN